MAKKEKKQDKFIVITQNDKGLRMDWVEGWLSSSEVIGMLELAKMTLQAQILYHIQTRLAQKQKEAK